MHYTLHLTNECNLACGYCYVARQAPRHMPAGVAKAAVDHAAQPGKSVGLSFFGGEPLLKKGLIRETVAYAQRAGAQTGCTFHFKITTNGVLMDEAFLDFCTKNRIMVGLSVDGTQQAHDRHRVQKDGSGSYEKVAKTAQKLLAAQPYACAMMVVNPDTIAEYADGVQNLFDLGFRYFICSLNYDAGAGWTDAHMDELARQYSRISQMYVGWTLAEHKFYFSPFEVKIRSHIDGERYCEQRCRLGQKQLSVDTDGRLYPCVQFAGDITYCVGDIENGVNEARVAELYAQSAAPNPGCAGCEIEPRCNHTCACLNRQATGHIGGVSPVMCAHERISLAAADETAQALFARGSEMFLHKQYNEMYPLISLIEDRAELSE